MRRVPISLTAPVHNPPFRMLQSRERGDWDGWRCLSAGGRRSRVSLPRDAHSRDWTRSSRSRPSEAYPLITKKRRLYAAFRLPSIAHGATEYCDLKYTSQLLKTLAEHDDVDAIWCFGGMKPAPPRAKALSLAS